MVENDPVRLSDTYKQLMVNQPDIVVGFNGQKRLVVIDVAVPGDDSIRRGEQGTIYRVFL